MKTTARSPKVSLIMPNYNYGKYLHQSLDGVINQTYKDFELIFIDDASTDNSLDILEPYLKKYPFIRLLKHQTNKGFYQSILDGLKIAKGKYISLPSSDDVLFNNFLLKNVDVLDKHPEIAVSFSKFATFNQDPKDFKTLWAYSGKQEIKLSYKDLIHYIKMYRFWIPGNTILCKKELFIKEGGYDPRFQSQTDWFVFLKMAFRYGAYYIPETLSALRVHENSLSHTESISKKQNAWHEMLKELSEMKNRKLKKAFVRSHIFNTFGFSFFDFILKHPKYWMFFKLYVYKHFYKRWKKVKQQSSNPILK